MICSRFPHFETLGGPTLPQGKNSVHRTTGYVTRSSCGVEGDVVSLLPIPIMRTKERGAMNKYISAAVFCTFVTLAHATDVLKQFES